MHAKMGENFKVTQSTQIKPKIKIANVEGEELQLNDDEFVDTIKKKQNAMEVMQGREMKIVKRLIRGREHEQNNKGRAEGSVLISSYVNCMFENQIYDLQINVEYSAIDRECQTYKSAMQEPKRRVEWKEQQLLTEEIIEYTNAHTLVAHNNGIRYQVVDRTKPAIIALSDTQMTAEIGDSESADAGIQCNNML